VCQRSADVVHPDVSDSQMDEFSHHSFIEVGTSQGIKAEEMLMGDEKRSRRRGERGKWEVCVCKEGCPCKIDVI